MMNTSFIPSLLFLILSRFAVSKTGDRKSLLPGCWYKSAFLSLNLSGTGNWFFLFVWTLENLFSYPFSDFFSFDLNKCTVFWMLPNYFLPSPLPQCQRKQCPSSVSSVMETVHFSNWPGSMCANLRRPDASSSVHIWLYVCWGNTHTFLVQANLRIASLLKSSSTFFYSTTKPAGQSFSCLLHSGWEPNTRSLDPPSFRGYIGSSLRGL
jgi:hypothetical protein